MDNIQSIQSIIEEIRDSDAVRIEGRLITLNDNFLVFRRNFIELKKILVDANKNTKAMLEIWSIKNRDKLDLLNIEITRLLQNFLASAKALVVQTRVAIKEHWYKGSDFSIEYQDKIDKTFKNNNFVKFIEELRNYCLHFALPFTNAEFKFTPNKIDRRKIDHLEFSFSLQKQGLEIWDEWKRPSKSYLSKADDDIKIEEFIENYYEMVEKLHKWINNRLKEIHTVDLEWLANMRKKARGMMTEEEKRDFGFLGD